MSAGTPVGGSRTYAQIRKDEPLTFETWSRAVRAGKTFVSNGPLLDLEVEGKMMGEKLRLPDSGGKIQFYVRAQSVWPIHTLEIIVNGRVVDATQSATGTDELSLKGSLRIQESCWIAARCVSKMKKQQSAMGRGHLGAHTSPVYILHGNKDLFNPSDAVYMLTLLEGTIAYLDTLGTRLNPKRHDEMHLLVREAEKALHTRLETHGFTHPH